MTLSPKDELTRQWLRVAADDLSLAELANAANPPMLSGVVYHCQQTFEKALKAYLVWQSQKPVVRRSVDVEAWGLAVAITGFLLALSVNNALSAPPAWLILALLQTHSQWPSRRPDPRD